MTPFPREMQQFLDRSFARFRHVPVGNVDSASERLLDRLRDELPCREDLEESYTRPSKRFTRWFVLVAAATATIVFAQQLVTRLSLEPLLRPSEMALPLAQASVEPQKTPTDATPRPLRFAAASLRTVSPLTMMAGAGLACRGIDGVQRIVLTATGTAMDAVKAPQGRCVGNGVFLSTLIEVAYGIPPSRIQGGPDWARKTGFLTIDFDPASPGQGMVATLPIKGNNNNQLGWESDESFQFEAVADNPATATLAQLRQMLQTALVDRFGLKFHLERRVVPGFSLVVAEGGHKLKAVSGELEESTVPTRGKSTLDKLARTLSSVLMEETLIVDKTGLKGTYEYELHLFPIIDTLTTPGDHRSYIPDPLAIMGGNISAKLEQQVGLRLQPEKAIAVDVLVIDSVKLPTRN